MGKQPTFGRIRALHICCVIVIRLWMKSLENHLEHLACNCRTGEKAMIGEINMSAGNRKARHHLEFGAFRIHELFLQHTVALLFFQDKGLRSLEKSTPVTTYLLMLITLFTLFDKIVCNSTHQLSLIHNFLRQKFAKVCKLSDVFCPWSTTCGFTPSPFQIAFFVFQETRHSCPHGQDGIGWPTRNWWGCHFPNTIWSGKKKNRARKKNKGPQKVLSFAF